MKTRWISIDQLPTESMKVKWLCEDGKEDIGYYYADRKSFAGFDLVSTKPITHWAPLPESPMFNQQTK